MTSRKPRIVLSAITILVLGVLALFAIALVDNRSTERGAVEQRFNDEAKVTSALIQSSFGSSAAQLAESSAKQFGSTVDPKALDALVKKSKLSYAVVLDANGRPIGQSTGVDPSVLGEISESPKHVGDVLKGQPWGMSGITKDNIAEYASPFKGADGKPRVLLQGFPVDLISGFVGGTLAQLPNAAKEKAYVADTNGKVIASADPKLKAGQNAPKAEKDRKATADTIDHSQWGVVLSQKKSDLYEGVGSNIQWLILIVLGGAGVLVVVLMRRALKQSDDLQAAYANLSSTAQDLEKSNLELKRSNGELEQFASVASHDLQEPLRKVQTFGDQLERRFGEDLPDEAKDYLRRMRGASARMSVLIEDLLRFSRVTTHAKPHVPVDLARVSREVTQDLEALVTESGGTVRLDNLPTVLADPLQMRQLLQNLIANGLKFHHPGEPPVVTVTSLPAEKPGMVAFKVADNGIGFEDTYGERIFRVFERLHPRDVYAGTGIGLALCRKIVERHGGSIEADGNPGKGAVFTVTLPGTGSVSAPPAPGRQQEPVHA